jgi:DNA-binding NarL/FixJ family response regulator
MSPARGGAPNARSEELARLGASIAARPYARRGIALSDRIIRVVLADDHAMVREGLRLVLRIAPEIVVVGEAESGNGAVEVAKRLVPHVVVLDLEMPGGDGRTALQELRAAMPEVRVLILTAHAEHEFLLASLEGGACGYLAKEAAPRDLVEAIRVVAAGEVYVRPSVARMLATAVVTGRTVNTARDRFAGLSEREQTVLTLVAKGYSGAEIARQLGISSKTVDSYKRRIQAKLDLAHRTSYVEFAIEAGVLRP